MAQRAKNAQLYFTPFQSGFFVADMTTKYQVKVQTWFHDKI
jgi:hypothetical protein